MSTLFSMIGLVCNIIFYETRPFKKVDIYDKDVNPKNYPKYAFTYHNDKYIQIIILTTILSVCCIFLREYTKMKWVNRYKKIKKDGIDSIEFYKRAVMTSSVLSSEGVIM